MEHNDSRKLEYWLIHLSWSIGVLLLCISALIVYSPTGNIIQSYLSFASAIASILLAVVAIFYSVISTQSFSSTLGALQRSSDNIEGAARSINGVSSALAQQSDRLVAEVSILNPAVMGIAEKVGKLASNTDASEKTVALPSSQPDDPFAKVQLSGALISLYLAARATIEQKSVKTSHVFPNRPVWQEYSKGFFEALHIFAPCGIKVDRTKVNDVWVYEVLSLGALDPVLIISRATASKLSSVKAVLPLVDAYFDAQAQAASDDREAAQGEADA